MLPLALLLRQFRTHLEGRFLATFFIRTCPGHRTHYGTRWVKGTNTIWETADCQNLKNSQEKKMSQLIPLTKTVSALASLAVLLMQAYPILRENYPVKGIIDLGRFFFPRVVLRTRHHSLFKTFLSLVVLNIIFQGMLSLLNFLFADHLLHSEVGYPLLRRAHHLARALGRRDHLPPHEHPHRHRHWHRHHRHHHDQRPPRAAIPPRSPSQHASSLPRSGHFMARDVGGERKKRIVHLDDLPKEVVRRVSRMFCRSPRKSRGEEKADAGAHAARSAKERSCSHFPGRRRPRSLRVTFKDEGKTRKEAGPPAVDAADTSSLYHIPEEHEYDRVEEFEDDDDDVARPRGRGVRMYRMPAARGAADADEEAAAAAAGSEETQPPPPADWVVVRDKRSRAVDVFPRDDDVLYIDYENERFFPDPDGSSPDTAVVSDGSTGTSNSHVRREEEGQVSREARDFFTKPRSLRDRGERERKIVDKPRGPKIKSERSLCFRKRTGPRYGAMIFSNYEYDTSDNSKT